MVVGLNSLEGNLVYSKPVFLQWGVKMGQENEEAISQ